MLWKLVYQQPVEEEFVRDIASGPHLYKGHNQS